MFVSITKDIAPQLPDLIHTILILISYLGIEKMSFLILEGPSSDCTADVFEEVLIPLLLDLGIRRDRINIITRSEKIDFGTVNRIEALAELRNKALQPLWTKHTADRVQGIEGSEQEVREGNEEVEAVIFFNDVFLRAGDVLEVLHQHFKNGAGITTGWDWYDKDPDYYYDVWVGRTVSNGVTFHIHYSSLQALWVYILLLSTPSAGKITKDSSYYPNFDSRF